MTAFDIENFDYVTEDKDAPTFFSRCATCEMGGNCRTVTVWYRAESGKLEVWDEYDMCDSCRYIAEYGVEMED